MPLPLVVLQPLINSLSGLFVMLMLALSMVVVAMLIFAIS